jgi:hypothetical protein
MHLLNKKDNKKKLSWMEEGWYYAQITFPNISVEEIVYGG